MGSCFILNLTGIAVVLMKIIFFSLPTQVRDPGTVDVVGMCREQGTS